MQCCFEDSNDKQSQLKLELDVLDQDPREWTRPPIEEAYNPYAPFNREFPDSRMTKSAGASSPSSIPKPDQNPQSTMKPAEKHRPTEEAVDTESPPRIAPNAKEEDVPRPFQASPTVDGDKVSLSPKKRFAPRIREIRVRLPPKATRSCPNPSASGFAIVPIRAEGNTEPALSVKPSTNSRAVVRSGQSAKTSCVFTSAMVDYPLFRSEFDTPASRALRLSEHKSRKGRPRQIFKTLIPRNGTAARTQYEGKSLIMSDLFERCKDVDLSFNAIKTAPSPKAERDLFELDKDVDLLLNAVMAETSPNAEILLDSNLPKSLGCEPATLFGCVSHESVPNFCDDYPYPEDLANKRQIPSPEGQEEVELSNSDESPESFGTPDLRVMDISADKVQEGELAKDVTNPWIDNDSSGSEASFYSLDSPLGPAELDVGNESVTDNVWANALF